MHCLQVDAISLLHKEGNTTFRIKLAVGNPCEEWMFEYIPPYYKTTRIEIPCYSHSAWLNIAEPLCGDADTLVVLHIQDNSIQEIIVNSLTPSMDY